VKAIYDHNRLPELTLEGASACPLLQVYFVSSRDCVSFLDVLHQMFPSAEIFCRQVFVLGHAFRSAVKFTSVASEYPLLGHVFCCKALTFAQFTREPLHHPIQKMDHIIMACVFDHVVENLHTVGRFVTVRGEAGLKNCIVIHSGMWQGVQVIGSFRIPSADNR